MESCEFELIGVPYSSMARPGGIADAIRVLREVGLAERVSATGQVRDAGDLELPEGGGARGASGLLNERALGHLVAATREAVLRSLDRGARPLLVGGDCPVLLGPLAAGRDRHSATGLLLVDGHEDAWPPQLSPTGEASDSEVAIALGRTGDLPEPLDQLVPLLDANALSMLGPRDRHEIEQGGAESLAQTVALFRDDESVRAVGAATSARAAIRALANAADAMGTFLARLIEEWDLGAPHVVGPDGAISSGRPSEWPKPGTFDNRGVAASSGTTPSTIAEMALDAIALIDALDVGAVDLLGFSIGSFVAQELALVRPSIVRSVVLASSAPQGASGMHGWAPDVVAAVGEPETSPEGYLSVFFTGSEASRAAGQRAAGRIFGARTADRDAPTSWQTRLAQYDAVCAWGQPNHSLLERVSAIDRPVFVANGDSDPMILPRYSYLLAGLIPEAQLKIYPDAAHGFLFQHHAEFAADVDTFLTAR